MRTSTSARTAAARRALRLPDDADVVPAARGASSSAWRVDTGGTTYVMRQLGAPTMAASRLAAMAAARAAGLPAPEVLRRGTTIDGEVALLSWLPGVPPLDVLARDAAAPRHLGEGMGRLQRRLHAIVAPPEVVPAASDPSRPFAAGREVGGVPAGDRLLHLDWHPLNLLVDEGTGELSGILDWDNARAGDPSLDLARTRAILTHEPGLDELPAIVRERLDELLEGWVHGYGPEAQAIPAAADAWAAAVMLADLAPRYADRPEALDRLRRWSDAAARG